jgi:hypothetical protein
VFAPALHRLGSKPFVPLTERAALRKVEDVLEKSNSDSDMTELIRNAHFLRGAIISSYAEVEFLLTDLNMRCRVKPAYAAIAAGFPYKLESKIARVRQLVAEPGPLTAYADDLLELVDRISAYETSRHFIAHGQMRVSTRATMPVPIVFQMYQPGKKNAPEQYGEIQTDSDQLTNLAREIADYARQMVALFARIYQELSLGPVPLALNV